MQEHFLSNIEIIDYKCFKNFKAKDFKRINLISGRNNVGKTAFMEALIINLNSKDIKTISSYLGIININRNLLEYLYEDIKKDMMEEYKDNLNKAYFDVKSNLCSSKFFVNEENGIKKFCFTINEKEILININEFSYEIDSVKNIYFIDSLGFTNNELKNKYEAIQQNDKEIILNQYINNFDSFIENFKIIGGKKPQCKTINGIYRDINEFGDGLKHYIGIICSLYSCENGQLFIDEIDNGIHYSQLEKLWEIIFTISKEVNCQVFATTHSKEMINAYAKVSQKLEDEDISFIELGKNKDNEVKANVYDKEMFLYELNQNHEVRGW
jgi:AAA15 family ATPase/GTPase